MLPIQILLIQQLERENQLRQLREQSRRLRDTSDPFSLPDVHFIRLFRLNKDLVTYLFQELQQHMGNHARISRINYQQRILITLRFYATGNYQRGIGQEYLLAVSQPIVSRSVEEVSRVLVLHFANDWIQFPDDVTKNANKREFFQYCGIPGIIGAIDCTHVKIVAPSQEEHAYLNRKGYHSINVQLICDTHLNISNVNARFPGSCHDSYIWRQSIIKNILQQNFQNGEQNTWLLGDSGYPQEPWLMTPILGTIPNTPEDRYNQAHARGRNHIERTNGTLKTRFRCLLGERGLRYSPQKAASVINACCILHNMCMRARVPLEENIDEDLNDRMNIERFPEDPAAPEVGRIIRQGMINRYFNN